MPPSQGTPPPPKPRVGAPVSRSCLPLFLVPVVWRRGRARSGRATDGDGGSYTIRWGRHGNSFGGSSAGRNGPLACGAPALIAAGFLGAKGPRERPWIAKP